MNNFFQNRFAGVALMVCLLFAGINSFAQQVKEPSPSSPEWSKPFPPFRIAGQLYYVGTYDLACYLIVTPKGNILINTGLAASTAMIKTNIESLGFKLSDIKILLTMQAHHDHMGAMAEIKKLTKARFMVDSGDSSVVATGGASDYALGGDSPNYAPVNVDHYLHDKEVISLGDMAITMLHHPGHTQGSCSFIFYVKDQQRSYRILLANLPTIVTEQNINKIPAYPSIAKDYAYTLSEMKT